MSAINAYLTDDFVVIATDTLAHYKSETAVIPKNFISKTFNLPQFNCCFTIRGYVALGMTFYHYLNEQVIANDVETVLQVVKASFFNTLPMDDYPNSHIGTINLFGYSRASRTLQGYQLTVTKAGIECSQRKKNEFILWPSAEGINDIIETFASSENPRSEEYFQQLMTALLERQKAADQELPLNLQVGIGGQIQFSLLVKNEAGTSTIYRTQMIHDFNDFESTYIRALQGEALK
ncbi:hypothetical protein [uncultured Chitinophaga sp.]|uniref:hypothetical protein n=1 Tax=uncultured Chitinophaga sp. TaxID=339340 RepID=UPI0026359F33|nr:hypothetical protein [uncultured Chitinophaga sp.]